MLGLYILYCMLGLHTACVVYTRYRCIWDGLISHIWNRKELFSLSWLRWRWQTAIATLSTTRIKSTWYDSNYYDDDMLPKRQLHVSISAIWMDSNIPFTAVYLLSIYLSVCLSVYRERRRLLMDSVYWIGLYNECRSALGRSICVIGGSRMYEGYIW